MSVEPGDWTVISSVLIFVLALLGLVINGFRKTGDRSDKSSHTS